MAPNLRMRESCLNHIRSFDDVLLNQMFLNQIDHLTTFLSLKMKTNKLLLDDVLESKSTIDNNAPKLT